MPFIQKPIGKILSCTSPDHNPPGNMVYPIDCDWQCPTCGKITKIFDNITYDIIKSKHLNPVFDDQHVFSTH